MKVLGKRVLSFLLALSMVITMSSFSSMGQITANAKDTTTKLYFELPDNTVASDWALHVWGGENLKVITDENTPTIKVWEMTLPCLKPVADKETWGYLEVQGDIDGALIVNAKEEKYQNWNSQITELGLQEAYFSTKNNKWYKDIDLKEEIKEVSATEDYYLVGEASLAGANWDINAESGKMSKISDNEFAITFNNIKAGKYEYKIVQDPKNFKWDKPFGGSDNRIVEVPYKSNVTFTINTADKEHNVKTTFEKIENSSVSLDALTVASQVKLLVDNKACDMDLYLNGIFEGAKELKAGDHTVKVAVNGKTAEERTITLAEDTKVFFRFTQDGLEDSVSSKFVHTATLVGNFNGLNFVDKDGEALTIESWNPADTDGDLTYIGGGLYEGTFKFNKLESDLEISDSGYKVAFDHSWDYSIGKDSGNIPLTIPAGTSELHILVDENNQLVYDSVRHGDFVTHHNDNEVSRNAFTTKIVLAGDINGWSSALDNGYMFTQISDTLYAIRTSFKAGSHQFKCVFNGTEWFENGGNVSIDVAEDDTDVLIVYDAATDKLYDSVNNANDLSVRFGMAQAPAVMSVLDNKNGTTTFVATGSEGQNVTLVYGAKSEVESKGKDALTKIKLGKIKTDSVSSKPIFFGDNALDIVYYYDIDGTKVLDASNETVSVNGDSYSNYKRDEFKGRKVNVPGTFPGPSWDAASNQMEYKGNGLYSYTFKNVPAANYEYKISFGSWTENYGVGGKQDGSNYGVNVPKTQDVTIFYTDLDTHLSVTSLNYKFVKAAVKGTGVAETELKDDGLTGVYSGTVTLEAGTYSDVDLIVDDQVDSRFGEFTLNETKDVTFYYAPDFGIAYNNAAEWNADDKEVKYDSKKVEYKNPFGAVEEGQDVTFAIATDDKVTDVKLVVKHNGTKTYDLDKKDGKWSLTTSFDKIGEYDYFFVLYTGPAVKVYCDDMASDYGEGLVTDLTSINPYDLVVYKKGYKTPDWMKNAVIYQIFPDRFYNGDESNDQMQKSSRGASSYEFINDWYALPENPEQEDLLTPEEYAATGAYTGDRIWNNEMYGGDLKGITKRIDYLKALGVNVIYLNPVFSSISSHRYDATDYKKIDPILGTLGDFNELVEIAQANGMKIVLDGVFNHVSDDSVYFDRYYKFVGVDGKVGAYPYWAKVYDLMADDSNLTQDAAEAQAKAFFQARGVSDFSYVSWFEVYTSSLKDDNGNDVTDSIGERSGKPVYGYEGWWGYDSMPVIKSTNGSEYQTGNWAENIIEGKDSVGQYWISQGSNGWRLDVANEVSDETWQHFRDSVKSLNNGDAVIIGEIWDDATEYLMGDMYDSVMNYIFRNAATGFAKGGSAVDSTAMLEKIRERYPREAFYAMMNLVGSHDTTRLLSYLDGVDDDRNQKDIDSAFPTYEKTSDAAKRSQYLVAFLQFTYAGAPTIYYGDEIGMTGSDDPDDRRAFTWGKGNKELVNWYASLAAVRKAYPVLRTGDIEPITIDEKNADAVMGFVRRLEDEEAIVLANNSDKAIEYTLDLKALGCVADKDYTEVLTDKKYSLADGKITVTIPSRNGVVLSTKPVKIDVDRDGLKPAYDPEEIVFRATDISSCKASLDVVEYVYDGKQKTPEVTITDGDKTLVKGQDYVVKYEDNLNVGTAKVIVTGINKYKGTLILSFKIKPNENSVNKKQNQTITVKQSSYSKKYGDAKFNLGAKAKTKLTYSSSNKKVATVDSKGNVTIKGIGVVTITIKAVENDKYNAAKKTVKITVKKGSQRIKVKVSSKTYKKSALKSNQKFTIGAKAAGKITYKVVKGSKYITVSKNGKVTVKKNIKKGTYKIVVTAKETAKYKKATRTIVIKIK